MYVLYAGMFHTFSHRAVVGSSTDEKVISLEERVLNRSTTLALMSVSVV